MKKLFLLFALVGMFATACEEGGVNEPTNTPTEKPDDGNGETPDDAYLTITMEVITFSPDGESVDIKVYSNYEWTLTNNCDWVTTSVTGGEASDAGTTVTLTADLTYDDREGTITFSCGKAKKLLVVSQSFKATIIADDNNTFNVSADGGTVELAYQTNVECEVIIPEEAQSWISLAPETRGLESGCATLNIANSKAGADRRAVVKVVKMGDQSVFAEYTITQERNMDYIIFYTTTNGETIRPNKFDYLTNTYEDGVGMLAFDGSKVTSIGDGAFSYCTSLASVTIPDSVNGIGGSAFYNCESLTSITIPDSVTSIGDIAFYGCTSLTSFYGKFASVDNRCLIVNGKLIAFAIGCGATEYTIPNSVTKIGNNAFQQCKSLTSITIPDSVTAIGEHAFSFCTSLSSITIPDSITSIGRYAFYDCTSLASVTIGNSVTEIGYSAFYDCTSLKEVYCKPTTPPDVGSDLFWDFVYGRKIYVPTESVETYKTAEGWSNYASDIVGYNF